MELWAATDTVSFIFAMLIQYNPGVDRTQAPSICYCLTLPLASTSRLSRGRAEHRFINGINLSVKQKRHDEVRGYRPMLPIPMAHNRTGPHNDGYSGGGLKGILQNTSICSLPCA